MQLNIKNGQEYSLLSIGKRSEKHSLKYIVFYRQAMIFYSWQESGDILSLGTSLSKCSLLPLAQLWMYLDLANKGKSEEHKQYIYSIHILMIKKLC